MKTVIDLDSDLVEAAAKVLGTRTKKETIHAALSAAIDAEKQRQDRHRRLLNSTGSPDLGDDEIMSGAWR